MNENCPNITDSTVCLPGATQSGAILRAPLRWGKLLALILTALVIQFLSGAAQSAPAGGVVVSGVGAISQAGSTTTITQTGQNLSLDWQSFNIAPAETVNFIQPSTSALAVNRIFDANPSQIFGHLNANGEIYLINPNGILFGRGSQINVGAIVATTLNLNDARLSSDSRSFSGSGTGSIVNEGTINAAAGGYVALMGIHVSNQGVIAAQIGTVALGAGSAVTLTFDGNSLVRMQVDQSVLKSLVENGGLIRADGGIVLMTTGALRTAMESVVNNTGVIEARTAENHAGTITLLAGTSAGTVSVGGTIDASAPNGGDGGFVETSGTRVTVADDARVTTAAPLGRSGSWLIDPQQYTVAASGGDVTGAALSTNLATTSIVLQSGGGGSAGSGDVNVNDAVSWNANTSLTLTASNNVNINANITATGNSAGVVINPNTANGAEAASGTGVFDLSGASITLSGANPSLSIAGTAYSVINALGAAQDATITPVTLSLQGIASASLAGHYALGTNIDAGATLTWNASSGFAPIGSVALPFTGIFDGLGHTITNLVINQPAAADIGLFGSTGATSVIRNVGLVGGSVVGLSSVGALVGSNTGTIGNSYATGTVSGSSSLGGLMGSNTGAVSDSHATGDVSGTSSLGGLMGSNTGPVSNSYATGNVSGTSSLGGLMGSSTGNVSDSFASGNVSGTSSVGGLMGSSTGVVSNSYATGNVTGTSTVGGLMGSSTGPVIDSYAVGSVVGLSTVGGLMGSSTNIVADSYWNLDTSGQASSPAGTGLTSAQTLHAANFHLWDFANTWTIYEGFTDPLLRSFMTPLVVTANSVVKTYDRQAFSGGNGVSYSSPPGADLFGTVSYGGTSQGAINAGTYTIVAAGLYSNQLGYILSYASGSLQVNRASLVVSGVTAGNKIYDATTVDILGGTAAVAALGSDQVFVGGTGIGTFADKNVGIGKAVSVSGFTLSGIDAANYTIVQPAGLLANITSASLVVSGVTAGNKDLYDATTADILGGTAAVTALGGDQVFVGGTGTGVFADKSVGIGKTVTVSGFTLSGTDAGNYTIVQPAGVLANITSASLVVSGVRVDNKVYDATTIALLGGTAAVTALGSDQVVVGGTGIGMFADKNVGVGKTVTVSGFALSGTDAVNYTIVQPTGLTADITTASLVVSGVTAGNKIYDANTVATLGGTAAVAALSGDQVVVGGIGVGSFADKNVGIGKAVNVSGFTLSGIDAANYTIVQPTGLTANISAASLLVTGVTAGSKVYDGTTVAVLGGAAVVTALGSDQVFVGGTGVGVFADKNAGIGKAVTVSSFTLSGSDAANYTIVQPAGLTADISAASLSVSGVTVESKVYDGTTVAVLGGAAVVTALGSDQVFVGGTGVGVFADKNAGIGKAVTVSGFTLSGSDAANYIIVQPAGLLADITSASLSVTGITAGSKVYDATNVASLGGTAVVTALGSDQVLIGGGGVGSFADKNVGIAKTVTVSGFTLSGSDAGNYVIVQPAGLTADISTASLLVSGVTADNKIYDSTTADILGGAAVVTALGSDEVFVVGSGVGSFADKNVGIAKTVTVSGFTLSGADAANYAIVQPAGLFADISAVPLLVSGVRADNKIYDATTADTLGGAAAVTVLGSDQVFVGGTGIGVFADKSVGMGKAVSVSGYTLSGSDSGNYVIVQPAGLTADITTASLSVTGVTAGNKVYDTTTADILGGAAIVTAFGSDQVFVDGTGIGAFADKNVGIGKTVTVSGFALGGSDAGNYTIVQPAGLTANISAASLLVTGVTAGSKVYDGTTFALLSGMAAITALASDQVVIDGPGIGAFADKNIGNGKAVSVSGFTLSGADAGNYTIVQPAGLTANISASTIATPLPILFDVSEIDQTHRSALLRCGTLDERTWTEAGEGSELNLQRVTMWNIEYRATDFCPQSSLLPPQLTPPQAHIEFWTAY